MPSTPSIPQASIGSSESSVGRSRSAASAGWASTSSAPASSCRLNSWWEPMWSPWPWVATAVTGRSLRSISSSMASTRLATPMPESTTRSRSRPATCQMLHCISGMTWGSHSRVTPSSNDFRSNQCSATGRGSVTGPRSRRDRRPSANRPGCGRTSPVRRRSRRRRSRWGSRRHPRCCSSRACNRPGIGPPNCWHPERAGSSTHACSAVGGHLDLLEPSRSTRT